MPRRSVIRAHGPTPASAAVVDFQRSKLRLFGVALLCAHAALIPLVFDHGADVPFPVPKAILSHGVAYLLAAVLIGVFLRFGRSSIVWSWLHLPVLAFLVVNAAATIFAADRTLALFGTHARMLGLGTIASWVVLYFAIVFLVRTRGEAILLIAFTAGASLMVLAYEAIQLAGMDPFQWTTDVTARPFSTIGQPTSLALYLTTIALGVLTLGLFANNLEMRLRGILTLATVALLAGAAATGTRSAVLGIGAGTSVLVILVWASHPSPRARALSLAIGFSVTVALAAVLFIGPLGARLATTLENAVAAGADYDLLARLEPSASGRVALYAIGLNMVRERPLLGFGPDNFAVGVASYRTDSEPREIQQSLATSGHSWIAYVATGSGLVGLACFLTIIGTALVLAVKGGFRPIAVAGAVMLAGFLGTGLTTVSDIGTDWLFWGSVASVAAMTGGPVPFGPRRAATEKGARKRTRQTRKEPAARRLATVACLAVGLALAVAGINAFDAARLTREGRDARLVGKIPQAIELASQATRKDPGRPDYWHDLGLAYVAASRWKDASAAFERASQLAPYDVRLVGALARAQLVLAGQGDTTARANAVALGEKALQTDPNNPGAHLTRAVVMQSTNNLSEALRSIDRALALDPQSFNDALYLTAAQINLASGRPIDAIDVARRGLAIFGPTARTIPLRLELARALVANGQRAEALQELDAAQAILPNDPSVERLRAQIRGQSGQ